MLVLSPYPQLQIKTQVGKILRARVHCLGVEIPLWFHCRHCRTNPKICDQTMSYLLIGVHFKRIHDPPKLASAFAPAFHGLGGNNNDIMSHQWDQMAKDHNGLGLNHVDNKFFLQRGAYNDRAKSWQFCIRGATSSRFRDLRH